MILEILKQRNIAAIKSKNNVEKNILRVIIGEVETIKSRDGKITDDQVYSLIRKQIEANKELINIYTLKGKDVSLASLAYKENDILGELLPKTLSPVDIEAEILNHDGPEYEMIQDAKTDGAGIGVAMKLLKSLKLNVLGDDVKKVVAKIRNENK